MTKFNIGDRVKCINSGISFTKGKEYIVAKYCDKPGPNARMGFLIDDNGSTSNGWMQSNFELVQNSNQGITFGPGTYAVNSTLWQSSIQRKWFINKNETLYFWDSINKYYGASFTFQYFLSYLDNFKKSYNLSQQEIDQILKEIKEEQAQLSFANITNVAYVSNIPENNPVGIEFAQVENHSVSKKSCNHQMVEYLGLNEKFNYCKLCGDKE